MLNLFEKSVAIVGGGVVASRKVAGLLESGAAITVISPDISPELLDLYRQGKIEWIARRFQPALLDEMAELTLVFGTTDQRAVNVLIYQAAMERRIPCNVADVPDLCTFFVPAVINQGDLMIAVSTGGASPALARRIREDLESIFGPEYAVMTRLMGDLRKAVLRAGRTSDDNRKVFTDIVDSEILSSLKKQDLEKVAEILKQILPDDVDPEIALSEVSRT